MERVSESIHVGRELLILIGVVHVWIVTPRGGAARLQFGVCFGGTKLSEVGFATRMPPCFLTGSSRGSRVTSRVG